MPTADPAHSTECGVAPLAHEAIKLIAQRRLFDGRSAELMDVVDSRLEGVERAASLGRATSDIGLFFQACVAKQALDNLESWSQGGVAKEQFQIALDAIVGLAVRHFTPEGQSLADFYLLQAFSVVVAG